ncbi:MAG: peptidylprolyl isomerase [Burkholderiaceae bacterium]|nr:peptidylprolyl isomerase [Burkholderiaceae bacterium]
MKAKARLVIFALAAIGAPALAADAKPAAGGASKHGVTQESVFALVGGTSISTAEYDALWTTVQRQKFYHRKAPEAEVAQVRREVGDQIINRVLLTEEVARRGVAPDGPKVQAQLAEYEQRYQSSPSWPKIKAERLPALTRELERQSALERLSAQVRAVPAPDERTARTYYESHPELFTEPEQLRFSIILLKVDPSSRKPVWDKAREEADAIRERIARGADFAEMARLHSSDSSAERGGDVGYVHRGMLPEGLAEKLAGLTPGQGSDPHVVLDCVAVLRFVDRKSARLREFDQVRERAGQLWAREASERQWSDFVAGLRKDASVTVVDATRYPPVQAAAAQ